MAVKKSSPKKPSKVVMPFSSRSVHGKPMQASTTTIGNRDMLLLTILSTAFLAIIFASFANDYGLAMYAMTAITVVASIAMILVVLLSRD